LLWALALVAVVAAGLSVERVLRHASGDKAPQSVILPARPAGADRTAKAVEDAANTLSALGGLSGGGEIKHDAAGDGLPAFDVARVEPSGDIVVAGRTTPRAIVELLRNGNLYNRVVADASGQFTMVPPKLPAGDSELTLRSRPPSGAPAMSKQTIVVSVPANHKDQPVVALMAPDQPSVILSKPGDASGDSIVVETVESEAGGRKLFVTGHTAPGALVRLYLNNAYQATGTADDKGRVSFTPAGNGSARNYQVRLEEVDRASGVVISRAEVPFTAPQGGTMAAAPGASKSVTVSRGDSLWRISRLAYGDGARYTVIYDANPQIRNPDRIYPGQVFRIPGKEP
ncbi:MAG: LysM peptidoglycan-binding domain-containing protein, partial [Bradyrhizobiaceae bacterium]|nr:LysM peptidoglycan-binding domain-containing protein [Bradyrhizobiaceae bacterium]